MPPSPRGVNSCECHCAMHPVAAVAAIDLSGRTETSECSIAGREMSGGSSIESHERRAIDAAALPKRRAASVVVIAPADPAES
jgi:hypothetical protein